MEDGPLFLLMLSKSCIIFNLSARQRHITFLMDHTIILTDHITALTKLLVDRLLFYFMLSESCIIFKVSAMSHNSEVRSYNSSDRSHNSTDRVVGWSSTVSSYVVFSCIVLSLTSQPHHITTLTVHITVLIHHITGLTGHITALTVHITVLIHHIIALTELLVDRLLFRLILSMSWIIFNLSASSSSIQDWNNKTHGLVNTLPFFLDQQCQCCFLFASYCVLHEKYIILPSNFWTWNKIFSSIFLNQFYLIFVNL